ncbi:hypothetical protein D6827_02525 [Candidatus Parcubacteria bacterium]|nr:MAG: hypothetical protein D6827_02525 [Candidatus Parcubacteria bacterium]
MITIKNTNAMWYQNIINRFEKLIKEIQANEKQAEKIKDFVLNIAREQYLNGNRSGIRWARNQSLSRNN